MSHGMTIAQDMPPTRIVLSRQVKPAVYVTYNGDFFDWPFIETRAAKLGMAMHEEIGFRMDTKSNTCLSK